MKSVNAAPLVSGPAHAITTPILVLVEGDDEYHLMQWMCQHWFGDKAALFAFENVKGKDNFPSRFCALKTRSLGVLEVVGVVADSEEDAAATHQRWRDLINEVTATIKQPCKLLQLPHQDQTGAFETLVLQALQHNAVAQCARAFRDCAGAHLNDRTQAQKDKIAVQAWLGASFGRAYGNVFKAQNEHPDATLLDYEHSAFASIKAFFEELLATVATDRPDS